MTVHVRDANGRRKTYAEAYAFEADYDTGYLAIQDIAGVTYAVYPPGAWIGVYQELETPDEEATADAELVPRVWHDIRDIPQGVDVIDNDGDALTWRWRSEFRDPDLTKYVGARWDWANGYGPFTEVIA